MDPIHSGVSTNGLDSATREHIMAQLQRELDAEVISQNKQARLQRDMDMREVSGMAQTLRDAIATLKSKTASATAAFQAEVNNSNVNIDKVTSLTSELKAANQEVEQMLGQSGSNFTPATSAEPISTLGPPDINGVQINRAK